MREQQRKQAQQGATPPSPARQSLLRQSAVQQLRARQAEPLGAVTAEENESRPLEREDRSRTTPTIPEEIRVIVNETRLAKLKQRKEQEPEERVEEIVTTAASERAYDITVTAKRRIAFNTNALRTFVVTREVLGPPRVRKPHRPGIRWR